LPTANLAASRIFFKQLANRHDAHAAKIISFSQNYECASVFDRVVGRYMVGALSFSLFLKIGPIPTRTTPGFTSLDLDARLVLAPRLLKQSEARAILE
jgi:hypothetical protein